MTSAQFKLDMFEGPLDLLLHLINKHKLNIFDIEISLLIEQYLAYMETLEAEDYDDAADFLAMAARLIYIKTVSLLPQDEEGEQLKKELEGNLIEYSLCKQTAALLRERYVGGSVFVREPVKLPVNKTYTGERDVLDLLAAYYGMSEKTRAGKPVRAHLFEPIVSKKIYSVTSKIVTILKRLYMEGRCNIDLLLGTMTEKSERVAAFLAVLELTKSGRIMLSDDNTEIYMDPETRAHRRKVRLTSDFDREEPLQEEPPEEEPQDIPGDIGPEEPGEDELISRRAADIMAEYRRAQAELPAEEPAPETAPETEPEEPAAPELDPEISLQRPGSEAVPLEELSLEEPEPDRPSAPRSAPRAFRPELIAWDTPKGPEPVRDEKMPPLRPNLFGARYYWGTLSAAEELRGGLWKWSRGRIN